MVKDGHYKKAVAAVPDMSDKVIAITGTTSGTGFEAAAVYAQKGAEVILLNRKSERADSSLAKLKELVPEGKFVPIECDLKSIKSVEAAAEAIKEKYDALYCLANNAGVMAQKDVATEDGFDVQMQVNHLSHFHLTALLMPLLEAGGEKYGEARVVSHTSFVRHWGGRISKKYLEKNGGKLGGNFALFLLGAPWTRYHHSKLANAVFMAALADKLSASSSKVISVACHPGMSTTNLLHTTQKNGGLSGGLKQSLFTMAQSQKQGSAGLIKCIGDPSVKNKKLYGPKSPFWQGFAPKGGPGELATESIYNNAKSKKLLWEVSEASVGPFSIGGGEVVAPEGGEVVAPQA